MTRQLGSRKFLPLFGTVAAFALYIGLLFLCGSCSSSRTSDRGKDGGNDATQEASGGEITGKGGSEDQVAKNLADMSGSEDDVAGNGVHTGGSEDDVAGNGRDMGGSNGNVAGNSGAGDGGEAPKVCGTKFCKSNEFCCNASCEICAEIGSACSKLPCKFVTGDCDVSECRPSTELTKWLCPDGSTAGPVCRRFADGTCAWMVTNCGATQSPYGCENCTKEQYCEIQNCGRTGENGTCTARPANCDMLSAIVPVCGCDGRDYGHPCYANASGVSVDYSGECAIRLCPNGFADCDHDPTTGCETSLNTINNCGQCGHSCEDTNCVDGACVNGSFCGGFAGFGCLAGEYCQFPGGGGCDMADVSGVCKTLQFEACTMEYNPVCGCDNTTYGNTCSAAGMLIRYAGECKTGVCTYGMDQTCNDNLTYSSFRGHCNQDGTCSCEEYNPQTGKCL